MKTIEEINADVESGEIAPIVSLYDFLELATHENFDALFALAHPKLRRHLIEHAIDARERFDRIIAGFGPHEDSRHWIAYRDWALRQDEVRLAPPRPRGITAGELRALQERLHDQGNVIADNRVAFMRAQTPEEREHLDKRRKELEERFARQNAMFLANRVAHTDATTQEERDRLEKEREELEKQFARENAIDEN